MGYQTTKHTARSAAIHKTVCMPNGGTLPPCKADERYSADGCCYKLGGVTGVDRPGVRNW